MGNKLGLQLAVLAMSGAALSNAMAAPAALTPASVELRSGFGGVAGYGELVMGRNDDGSSNRLDLPFSLNFFGTSYSTFFVNNNGNVSFNSSLGTYTPTRFPIASQPMIAPYWGDVDTRGAGAVYVASPNANSVVVTWNNVGYFSGRTDKLNNFQLTLLNRSDTGAGNFDIEFRYNQLQWTTGSASGGSGGLGGTPAQAGYDAGNRTDFFALPGSLTAQVLDLATTSNVSTSTPGLWTMAVRNGSTSDGSSAQAPLLPVIVQEDGFRFDFNIQPNQQIFIDPIVAVGYEYTVTSGPNIRTVLLPTVAGDTDGYQIYSADGSTLLGTVLPGVTFDFGLAGVSGFQVLDIEPGAGLDPNDPTAFVTGLTFVGAGAVSMTQDPLTVDTDNNAVPEPSSALLGLMGLLGIGGIARQRRRRAA